MARLFILDVAHGNCALIQDEDEAFVVDCAPGATLIDTLDELGIERISYVLLSHSDEDHIGGVITLLLAKHVEHVYLNADAIKKTDVWQDMLSALAFARRSGKTKVHSSLTTNDTEVFKIGTVSLQVLAPLPEDVLGGVGGLSISGKRQYSNTLSAVIRVCHESHPVALLSGDMDNETLNRIQNESQSLTADILVFPHHGGKPGKASAETFASRMCEAVTPSLILFSIGRSTRGFPRPEVIKGLKSRPYQPHLCCTQLSKDCASIGPDSRYEHLLPVPAKGKQSNSCCGGSLVVELNGKDTTYESFVESHKGFVHKNIPTPLCRTSYST